MSLPVRSMPYPFVWATWSAETALTGFDRLSIYLIEHSEGRHHRRVRRCAADARRLRLALAPYGGQQPPPRGRPRGRYLCRAARPIAKRGHGRERLVLEP